MPHTPIFCVCFYGEADVAAHSPAIAAVARAQRATVRAQMARLAVGPFVRRILVTNAADLLAAPPPHTDVIASDVLLPGAAWHFGVALHAIASRLAADDPTAGLLYIGGGAGPLLRADELAAIATLAPEADVLLAANNYYSADIALVRPLALLADPRTAQIGSDNDLLWRLDHDWPGLHERRRYAPIAAPAAAFDIDTPLDAAQLLWALRRGLLPDSEPGAPALRAFGADTATQLLLEPLVVRLEQVRAVMAAPERTLLVAGRLNATTLRLVEQGARCQTRAIAEERGMRASGRAARGGVVSLLGALYDAVGPDSFFGQLAACADAAILDSRVLFAHWQRQPSQADRFQSDLFDAAPIADPAIRAFTTAAAQSDIPLLLGGHSAVAGGLRLLLAM